jgi:thioredoxin 1
MGTNTVVASSDNFDTIINGETPVLVDFWAAWCGPCRAMEAPLEEIAGEHSAMFRVAKLNVDENPQISMDYRVMSIPTMIVFKGGQEAKRLVGARSKAQLVAELGEFLA